MKRAYSWLAVASAALLLACGGNSRPDNNYADSGPRPDAAMLPDGGGGTGTDATPLPDAPMDMSGPTVEVLAPTATPAGSFSSDDMVTTDRVTVRCKVAGNTNTGDGVDASSIKIDVLGGGGESVSANAQPTTTQDEYDASVSLAGFANGALAVRCTASDLADPPRTNSAENDTFLDLGPQILVFSPVADASIASAVDIIVRVSAAPVASGDTGAAPDKGTVTASIAGVDLSGDLTEDPAGSSVFRATVSFDDPRFDPALDGPQTLTVTAANSRSPDAVTRTSYTSFNADSAGPTIAIDSPAPGDLVAGIFSLEATITDSAGVDDTSVVATIAGTHDFSLQPIGSNKYRGSFDSRALPRTMVFPAIVVRAKDSVGNQSSVGEVVTLDNVAPISSLDPPMMRESFVDTQSNSLICSSAFDPVGSDAVDDGESVAQLSELRARVEDLGNGATAASGVSIPYAGIAKVQMFIVDDSDRALIVDTNGDGVCDSIDPNLVPTSVPVASNEAAVIDMLGLAPSGDADFTMNVVPGFNGTTEANCNPGTAADPPSPICDITSPATRITKPTIGTDPVIFSIPPANGIQCMGNAFDAVATNISDGWACVAIRAEDTLGNVGISAPLRVCIDSNGDMVECPAWGTVTTTGLPDCTGTWTKSTGVTDPNTDCTLPPTFEDYPGLQLRRNDL